MDIEEFNGKVKQLTVALSSRTPRPGFVSKIVSERPDLWHRILRFEEQAGMRVSLGDISGAAESMREYQNAWLDAFRWFRIEYGDKSEFGAEKPPAEARECVQTVMEVMGDCPFVEYRGAVSK